MAAVPVHLAQGGHRLAERGEGGQRVGGRGARQAGDAVLHDVLPPALGVVVPRRLGQHPDRVDGNGPGLGLLSGPGLAVLPGAALVLLLPGAALVLLPGPGLVVLPGAALPLALLRHGQGVCCGQVDEADRDTVRQGPADRDPFGRERGERPERRPAWVVHRMGEQGDGRPHLLVGGERQQRVALGRALDEHRLRAGRVQGGTDGAGGPRAVVPHPEQERPRRARGHTETSRQAR